MYINNFLVNQLFKTIYTYITYNKINCGGLSHLIYVNEAPAWLK